SPKQAKIVQELDLQSLIVAPLIASDKVIGLVYFARGGKNSKVQFDEIDLALASQVSDRVALALENLQLHKSSDSAIKLREEVIHIVAHDVRNPVISIRMRAAMAKNL